MSLRNKILKVLKEDNNNQILNLISKLVEYSLKVDEEKKYVCGYKVEGGDWDRKTNGERYRKTKVTIFFNAGYGSPNWPNTQAINTVMEAIMNEVQDKILSTLDILVDMYGKSTPNCESVKLDEQITESELPINVRRRLNFNEENIINLLKKFALRHSGQNVKIDTLLRMTFRDVAYELIDATQLQFGDEIYQSTEDELANYLHKKYWEQLKEFIENFFDESGDELGSRYVFEKHSERYGGNGFTEGYETWNMLLKVYSSWFPDLDWKELKMKLDNMSSGGKILIKKPGDKNNVYNYYFSLQRFDVPNKVKGEQTESELTERCWKGYTQKGMKTMFGKKYPNCVKKTK